MNSFKVAAIVSYEPLQSSRSITGAHHANFENETFPSCYICMETMHGEVDSPFELIAPCLCNSYVHRKCLNRWRFVSRVYKTMNNCPNCQETYQLDSPGIGDGILRICKTLNSALILSAFLSSFAVIYCIDSNLSNLLGILMNAVIGVTFRWIEVAKLLRLVIYFFGSLIIISLAFVGFCFLVVRWYYRHSCTLSSSGVCDCLNNGCSKCFGTWRGSTLNYNDCITNGKGGGKFSRALFVIVTIWVFIRGIFIHLAGIVGNMCIAIGCQKNRLVWNLQLQLGHVRNLRPLTGV